MLNFERLFSHSGQKVYLLVLKAMQVRLKIAGDRDRYFRLSNVVQTGSTEVPLLL